MKSIPRFVVLWIGLLAMIANAGARDAESILARYRPAHVDECDIIAQYNRVHHLNQLWPNVTNWGFYGNWGINDPNAMEDPEYPGIWAPQCEYPGDSGVQYLWVGALWIGALVQDGGFQFPRVSTGFEGWTGYNNNQFELQPGEAGELPIEEHGILERSNNLGEPTYSPEAIAPQEFIAVYTDTLTDSAWVGTDIVDGPHFSLGLRVSQKSMVWDTSGYEDFVIIEYAVANIGSNFLKDIYLGLYMDADVGWTGEGIWHDDDICGFLPWYYFMNGTELDSLSINCAFIADNDGRPQAVGSGSDFTCPDVTGVSGLFSSSDTAFTCFNWWMPNGNPVLDFGPHWVDDGAEGNWTDTLGTPNGDARKYFVMSNREIDYSQFYAADQDYIENHPQVLANPFSGEITVHPWVFENLSWGADLANGYDTRYLISWGPLGIFDHIDPAGNRIYRLNPGEAFTLTLAYVAGEDFHQTTNPQGDLSGNNPIDPTRYSFADLAYNCAQARSLFDAGYTGIEDGGDASRELPEKFSLKQNFPNPFNATTVASYELRVASHVSLRAYDTAGRLVATLVDGWRQAGRHEVTFNGSDLSSGVYIYRLEAGKYSAAGKMVLLK